MSELQGLTEDEKKVLDLTVDVWNSFLKLPLSEVNPSDYATVRSNVRSIQNVIGSRVASRIDPEIWRLK